jgi:subtilisin family serine protease
MWINPSEIDGDGLDNDLSGYPDDIHGIDSYAPYDESGDPMDVHDHGTHCAGIIGATGNNVNGIAGVAWNVDVKIMALKFMRYDSELGRLTGSVYHEIECIDYAISMKQRGHNVKVINASFGGEAFSWAEYEKIKEAGDWGILFVASAGNGNQDNDTASAPFYPSSYDLPNIIAVAGTDRDDRLLYSDWPSPPNSNWGRTSVDVAAPAQAIWSCVPVNGYFPKSGTSMAAAHVSGLAALIWSQNPSYDWKETRLNTLFTADPIANLEGLVLTGCRINANNALNCDSGSDGLHVKILRPRPGFVTLDGEPTVVEVTAGTCDGPLSDASVTLRVNGGDPLELQDDGEIFFEDQSDHFAGDGQFIAAWIPTQLTGNVTLEVMASALGHNDVSETVEGEVQSVFIEKLKGPKEPGTVLGIVGKNFGDGQGESVVHIGNKSFAATHKKIRAWGDTRIRIRLPFTSKTCSWFKHGGGAYRKRKVWVTVNGKDSNIKKLKVIKPATLDCSPSPP